MLKHLFSSTLRVKILEYFFFHPGEEYYVSNLASLLDDRVGTVARELINLEEAGILSSRQIGKQKHYSLRQDCPILEDLKNIFLKTAGASKELRDSLETLEGVELAFLYGSYAKGEAGLTSDLDLMIIGEPSSRKLASITSKIERKLRREINYTCYSRSEAESRMKEVGSFVHEVFIGQKILLVGGEDDKLLEST